MPKKQTPTFILELPLQGDQRLANALNARFEAGRQLYNALLHEASARMKRMRSSPAWQAACGLHRHLKQERKQALTRLREQYGFREYDLHKAATKLNTSWLKDHLDANTTQKLASRAYHAVNRICLGKGKRVRFKSKGRGIGSLEGKTNTSGIRFVLHNSQERGTGHLVWGSLSVPALIEWDDPVVHHGLTNPIKYVRIVRCQASSPKAKGADRYGQRYAVQLIVEGVPYQKPMHTVGKETIGIDLGPSSIAMVGRSGTARLEPLCAALQSGARQKRQLQRKLERQRRANNPQRYDEQGRVKRGRRLIWKQSNGYRATLCRLATIDRKLAAHRKSLHGQLAHEILQVGNTILIEKQSPKGWQRRFGKSVGLHAPGMLIAHLKRLVASTGGSWHEVPTRTTKLSQYCHNCHSYKKKPLSERWHQCVCGIGPIQRDLYSAFLIAHMDEQDTIPSIAQSDWEGSELSLRRAMENLEQRARRGESFPACMGIPRDRVRLSKSLAEGSQEPALLWNRGRLEAWPGRKNLPGL